MGLIYKEIRLTGPKGSGIFKALIGTGASESFIRSREAGIIAQPFKMPETMAIELGKGMIEADEAIFAYADLDGYRLHWTFIVVPSLTEEVIIGADFLQRWKIKINLETEEIVIDPKALRLKLV